MKHAAVVLSAVMMTWGGICCRAADFDELAEMVPIGANVALIIDVDRILSTDMASKNGWGSPDAVANRPMYLPPEADRVVVSAQVDPVRRFAQAWEVAVISLKESLPMRLIARAEGGYTDTLNGQEVAWVPSDAYFVSLGENILGLIYPANRQAVSRWLRQRQNELGGISDYLRSSIQAVSAGPSAPQMVLAFDARDAVQPHRVHQDVSESPIVKEHELNVEEITNLLVSLVGARLKISISDSARGRAEISFGQTIPFDADVAKALVLNALTNLEAELPGADNWVFRVEGSMITAEGDLDEEALRRVLSVVEIPSTKFSSLREEDTESEASQDEIARHSLAYFQSVTKLVEGLQKRSKSSNGDNFWFDRYAKKIDRLPILHVDPDLLDYGQKTAETLRYMSGKRKGANIDTGVARSNINASGGYGYGDGYSGGYNGYYGYYGYRGAGYEDVTSRSRAESKAHIAAKNRIQAGATKTKIEGFRLIENATFEIRRTMTERYGIEF